LFGIANTLSLAVYERRREIGLLRAVGQTRRQVRSVLRLESVIIATFGTLVGLALGSFLGWSVFAAIGERNATADLPVAQLSVLLGLVAAATGIVLGLGTKWGLVRYWWVLVKEVIVVPVVLTDLFVVAPGAHDAALGNLSARILDPAIAHCVVLTTATVVSL